ncbi:MAG TPA: phosphoribosylglycinamide formyltransferase [Cytophagaceae bacterium]|jgi:phosphoribosylglycinamide formyltransferase-1|nr:phosphoribosylglycinamide formyltransferase [Cytophagaceae bacterium]
MYNIAILASGSGSNAENIIRYFQQHAQIHVQEVLANKPDAYVLERATNLNIPTRIFNKESFLSADFSDRLLREGITHVVLAGFLWLAPSHLIKAFPSRILNIHPALLPKYGGKGMYGSKVHEAVVAAGEKESGITIHLVNEEYDKGAPLFQISCTLEPGDSADEVAAKVHQLEYEHFPRVIENWIINNQS